MLFRTISLNKKAALLGAALASLVACAPDAREDDADAGGGAAADAAPDGMPFIDSGPLADGGDAEFIVYVHSRDTLYTMDPTTFEVTLVGAFGTGTDYITDLAVQATTVLLSPAR